MAMINCPGCGREVTDASAKCPYCGKALRPEAPKKTVRLRANPLGIAGFVLTLANTALSIFYSLFLGPAGEVIEIILHIAALALCGIGISKAKKNEWGTGLAIAGLVLSILFLVGTLGLKLLSRPY